MDVTTAVTTRRSIRAFTDATVDDATIADLLRAASRAPSGGNLQPWRIFVVGHETMPDFQTFLAGRDIEPPAYEIYPASLWDPYRTNRFAVGEQMYDALGIARDDKAGRLTRVLENYRFFGAPQAIFCFVDRGMGRPQWSDLGMFLQTFMLLCTEAGIDTCAQESWAMRAGAVTDYVGAPEELELFCGVAIGHADPDQPVNAMVSERQPVEEWTTFVTPPADAS